MASPRAFAVFRLITSLEIGHQCDGPFGVGARLLQEAVAGGREEDALHPGAVALGSCGIPRPSLADYVTGLAATRPVNDSATRTRHPDGVALDTAVIVRL